jgi:predicted DCC family thiol-disulfide oxidoreductase YuxK
MRSVSMVLLYDGVCGFCDRFARFVLNRDAAGALRFAPLQGSFAAGIVAAHPELAGADSLVFVTGEGEDARVRTRSDAIIAVLRELGGGWRVLAWLVRLVPRPLRDAVYAALARVRYRVFGRRDACRVPAPEERSRFLD